MPTAVEGRAAAIPPAATADGQAGTATIGEDDAPLDEPKNPVPLPLNSDDEAIDAPFSDPTGH